MRAKNKLVMAIYIITAIALLTSYSIITFQLIDFNNTKYKDTISCLESKAGAVRLTRELRTGRLGNWKLDLTSGDIKGDKKHQLTGAGYSVTLTNNTLYSLQDWTASFKATGDCYISSSWDGEVEIHQFRNGSDYTQKVNFGIMDTYEITLEHYMEGKELLVPLHEGDYFIYYPSKMVGENVLKSTRESEIAAAAFGFNFYYNSDKGECPIDFESVDITYYLNENVENLSSFKITQWLTMAWACSLFVVVVTLLVSDDARKRQKKTERILQDLLQSVGELVDKRCGHIGHSRRVADYAVAICKRLELDRAVYKNYYYCTFLHDLGKLSIPESILLKDEDKLTGEELDIYKKHAALGLEKLQKVTELDNLSDAILYHHENYDGTGYPMGLVGDNIPFVARLIAVAEECDKKTDRIFTANTIDYEIVIDRLIAGSGSRFDPVIVSAAVEELRAMQNIVD